jgi:hypothetical protein
VTKAVFPERSFMVAPPSHHNFIHAGKTYLPIFAHRPDR